jgi:hypothetical protein
VHGAGCDGPYEGNPLECLAAYVFQEDLWNIIPAVMVVGQGSIALYPKLKGAKYGPCKEEREKEGTLEIHACAVEWPEERVSWAAWIWRALRGETYL